jgi:hypothetical protein
MSQERAKEILIAYQLWRTGETDEIPFTPQELSQAINIAISLF